MGEGKEELMGVGSIPVVNSNTLQTTFQAYIAWQHSTTGTVVRIAKIVCMYVAYNAPELHFLRKRQKN